MKINKVLVISACIMYMCIHEYQKLTDSVFDGYSQFKAVF